MPAAEPADLGSLLLADARLPTGGYAHSAGLEAAIVAGLGVDGVPTYLAARLRTAGTVDAAATVLARRIAGTAPDRLIDVQDALAARMPSAPLRANAQQLGRSLTRLTTRRWPNEPAVLALGSLEAPPLRPIALGVFATMLGLTEEQSARASLYEDLQTVAAAALKLLPVDPADTMGWVLDLADQVEVAVTAAVGVVGPDDPPAYTAPQIEQFSLDHHHRTRRIFVG